MGGTPHGSLCTIRTSPFGFVTPNKAVKKKLLIIILIIIIIKYIYFDVYAM